MGPAVRARGPVLVVVGVLLGAALGATGSPVGPDRPVPADHTRADAECEVPVPSGDNATCSDSWDQPFVGRVGVYWHAGLHSTPAGALVSGEVVLEWYSADHLTMRWVCTPHLVEGDAGNWGVNNVTGHCDLEIRHRHYHAGPNRINVTAAVDPTAGGVDDCPVDRLLGGSCRAHGRLTLGSTIPPEGPALPAAPGG